MKKKISFLWASWFKVGYCPVASGTAGSLAALPVCWLAIWLMGTVGVLLMAAVLFYVGLQASKEVLKYTKHDPALIVIDEVVGQLLTFTLVANSMPKWWVFLVGFVLFRVFDIIKVWPANYYDKKVYNAYGVMMDDVVAGLYAAIILYWIV